MRRIISILMIARLIQRLINGSRRPGLGRGQRRFDEPRQGTGGAGRRADGERATPSSRQREPIEGSVVNRKSERSD